MPLCQVAISATHLLRTHYWYRRALGFRAAGDLRHRESEGHAPVSDVPESSFDVWCLVGRQDWFQIEMFEFQKPRMRMIPADWRPSDFGYSTLGLHVSDFERTLERLMRTSGRLLSEPLGSLGQRRVCLRDPEGILLELMEEDLRQPGTPGPVNGEVPPAIRSVTVSVPNLDRAYRFWVETLGLIEAAGITLHSAEHEGLWGLDCAKRRSLLLWAGDILIELVQYAEPMGRQRPAGYLMTDQGILNVALGSRDKEVFDHMYDSARAAGYRFNSEPWTVPGVATVVYLNDDQGFSVELLHVEPGGMARMGFVATPDYDAPRSE